MSPTLEKTNSSVGYIRDNTTKTLPTRGIVSEYSPHKNLANENALFFKFGPIKLEL
jgi:hypothetical protein